MASSARKSDYLVRHRFDHIGCLLHLINNVLIIGPNFNSNTVVHPSYPNLQNSVSIQVVARSTN